jgi:hypothetical protein
MSRNEKGQFEPGQSGNPLGRARTDITMRDLARQHGPEMLELLVAKARKGSIAAMVHVLDRGHGKPEISVDFKVLLEKKISELSEDELIALRSRLTLLALPAPVIEHHETDGEE